MTSSNVFLVSRLTHALSDWRQYPVAYPILADHGEMERTANGYKAIDAEAFILRCNSLINKLQSPSKE